MRLTVASTGRVSVRSTVRPLVSTSRMMMSATSGRVVACGSGSVTSATALPASSVVPTTPERLAVGLDGVVGPPERVAGIFVERGHRPKHGIGLDRQPGRGGAIEIFGGDIDLGRLAGLDRAHRAP